MKRDGYGVTDDGDLATGGARISPCALLVGAHSVTRDAIPVTAFPSPATRHGLPVTAS